MTTEDKKLLIKDLSARLPYGVYIEDTRCGIRGRLRELFVMPKYKGDEICDYSASINFYHDCYYDDIEVFKPYLFPMLSMTEEQTSELLDIVKHCEIELKDDDGEYWSIIMDWYNKNHIDYRCLIEKGLALDATGKNIY